MIIKKSNIPISKSMITDIMEKIEISQYVAFSESKVQFDNLDKGITGASHVFIRRVVVKTSYFFVVESIVVPGLKECINYVDLLIYSGPEFRFYSENEAFRIADCLKRHIALSAA